MKGKSRGYRRSQGCYCRMGRGAEGCDVRVVIAT
jgi:hypothetical protein